MRCNNVNKVPDKSTIKPLLNCSFPCFINAYPLTCPQLHLLESLGPFKPHIWSKPMYICAYINLYRPLQRCKVNPWDFPRLLFSAILYSSRTPNQLRLSCLLQQDLTSLLPESWRRRLGMDPKVVRLSFSLFMPAGTQLTLPTLHGPKPVRRVLVLSLPCLIVFRLHKPWRSHLPSGRGRCS